MLLNKGNTIMALSKTQYICPSCGRKAVKQDSVDSHGHCFGCSTHIHAKDMELHVMFGDGANSSFNIQRHINALQNLGCSLMVQSPDASVHMRVPKDASEVESAVATKKADGRAAIVRKHDPKKAVIRWETKHAKRLKAITESVIAANGEWVMCKNPDSKSEMRLFQSAVGNNLTQVHGGQRGLYETKTRGVEERYIKVRLLKAIK
jgi:ribosomal protein L37AE/L43A